MNKMNSNFSFIQSKEKLQNKSLFKNSLLYLISKYTYNLLDSQNSYETREVYRKSWKFFIPIILYLINFINLTKNQHKPHHF